MMKTEFSEFGRLMADESFQRWLSGAASEEEERKWRAWLEKNPLHRQLLAEARELWRLLQFKSAPLPDVENEMQRLTARLDAQEQAEKRRTAIGAVTWLQSVIRKRAVWRPGFALLAVLAIGLFLLEMRSYLSAPSAVERSYSITTAFGQRSRVTTSDGSEIILNGNSSLQALEQNMRRFLLEGEAYFSIVPAERSGAGPFTVFTRHGAVEVLGTRFVVTTRNEGTRLAVEEGRVRVLPGHTAGAGKQNEAHTVMLGADEHIVFFADGRTRTYPEAVALLDRSWWKDSIVLDRTPLRLLLDRIESTYGVTCILENSALADRTLSGSIENLDLNSLVGAIAQALKLKVQREGTVLRFSKG